MTVYILISNGLPIPYWEQYLTAPRAIYFCGEDRQMRMLSAFAQKRNISFYAQTPEHPTQVLGFWNGRPDFVDNTLCCFPRCMTHLFLLNENGEDFEEYIPQI